MKEECCLWGGTQGKALPAWLWQGMGPGRVGVDQSTQEGTEGFESLRRREEIEELKEQKKKEEVKKGEGTAGKFNNFGFGFIICTSYKLIYL